MIVPQSTSIAAWRTVRERESRLKLVESELKPIVLVPTRAQLARGERVIDATPDQIPQRTAAPLIARLTAAGVRHRVTYSHALLPPKRGSDDWQDVHTVVIRVFGRGFIAYANGTFDCALWGWRVVGATEFASRVMGGDYVPPQRRPVESAPCPVDGCGRAVRIKGDGTPYAHRCADGASMDSQVSRRVRYPA